MPSEINVVPLIASMVGIFATLVTLAVWMVKQSSKRQEIVTDRFIKHMEDTAASREAETRTRAKERETEATDRRQEREEFLQGLRENNEATRSLAEAVRDLSNSVERHSSRLEAVEEATGVKTRKG